MNDNLSNLAAKHHEWYSKYKSVMEIIDFNELSKRRLRSYFAEIQSLYRDITEISYDLHKLLVGDTLNKGEKEICEKYILATNSQIQILQNTRNFPISLKLNELNLNESKLRDGIILLLSIIFSLCISIFTKEIRNFVGFIAEDNSNQTVTLVNSVDHELNCYNKVENDKSNSIALDSNAQKSCSNDSNSTK